jgi:transmembrane sensor
LAHHADKPFRVITRDQVIEDIGTAFNVNAYNDEPATKTILLEGIVEIFSPETGSATGKKNAGLRLSPGQQAVTQNHKISVSRVNTEDAIAWKNGYFRFSDENIESIMRKLSRWYDLEVEYRGSSSQIIFNGEIPRSTSLSGVLKVLEAANIHFTMEGNKLIFKE